MGSNVIVYRSANIRVLHLRHFWRRPRRLYQISHMLNFEKMQTIWALLYSHAVLHLPQRTHDIYSVCFTCCLLNRWILWEISTYLLLS